MILACGNNSVRLVSFLLSDITYFKDVKQGDKFDYCFIAVYDDENYDLRPYIHSKTILFVDFVTESGRFYKSHIDSYKSLNIKYNCKKVFITDVISDNIQKLKKLYNLEIFNSKVFNFYASLTFTRDSFSVFAQNQYNTIILQNNFESNRDFLFTSRNGRVNPQRIYTVYKLFKENLIEKGKVSALFYSNQNLFMGELNYMDNAQVLKSKIDSKFYESNVLPNLPITVDNLIHFDNGFLEVKGHLHHVDVFKNSYIDLVTENSYWSDDNVYQINTMTEKTIKPFLNYQIPLFVSQKNFAHDLKNLGFDLFEDLIDLEYDTLNDEDRIDRAIENLVRLKDVDLESYFKINKHRFYKNKNLCLKLAFSDGLKDITNFINTYKLLG